jgi:G:T-mismatch repair DNA endonuclease (very short patch repair protein)
MDASVISTSRCRFATRPVMRPEFWSIKLDGNRERDRRVRRAGWRVLVVWECDTRHSQLLAQRLDDF